MSNKNKGDEMKKKNSSGDSEIVKIMFVLGSIAFVTHIILVIYNYFGV